MIPVLFYFRTPSSTTFEGWGVACATNVFDFHTVFIRHIVKENHLGFWKIKNSRFYLPWEVQRIVNSLVWRDQKLRKNENWSYFLGCGYWHRLHAPGSCNRGQKKQSISPGLIWCSKQGFDFRNLYYWSAKRK